MPKKVRKVFGENPEVVTVLSTQVSFDESGNAIVEDEIADILEQIPGYEVDGEAHTFDQDLSGEEEEETVEAPSEEDEEEEEVEEEVKPKRPARKTPKRG